MDAIFIVNIFYNPSFFTSIFTSVDANIQGSTEADAQSFFVSYGGSKCSWHFWCFVASRVSVLSTKLSKNPINHISTTYYIRRIYVGYT